MALLVRALRNSETSRRLAFTFGMVALVRGVTLVPMPTVDPYLIHTILWPTDGGVLPFLNIAVGGALSNCSIGALGLLPYLSACMAVQVFAPIIPPLRRLRDRGRIWQAHLWLTFVLCAAQGVVLLLAFGGFNSEHMHHEPSRLDIAGGVVSLMVGTFALVGIGKLITWKGLGNGVAIIVAVSVVSALPSAWLLEGQRLFQTIPLRQALWLEGTSVFHLLALLVAFVPLTAFTVALLRGARRVPIRFEDGEAGDGWFPVPALYGGILPIVFAQAALMVLGVLLQTGAGTGTLPSSARTWLDYRSAQRFAAHFLLVVAYTVLWVLVAFPHRRIASNLARHGGRVAGAEPGEESARVLRRTALRGACLASPGLGLLAMLPMFLTHRYGVPDHMAQYFGGVNLLVIVAVALDTVDDLRRRLE